jgi:hypothetical protein
MLLYPAEIKLINYMRNLGYGTLSQLHVQDGLPVIALQVVEKTKFTDSEPDEEE